MRAWSLELWITLALACGCSLRLDEAALSGGRSPDAEVGGDAAPACLDNLLSNSSFEDGTSGWGMVGGLLGRAAGGHEGAFAAEATADGSESYYRLGDEPDAVTDPAIGETFHLIAWVRSDAPEGQFLAALIRERSEDGTNLEQETANLALEETWQKADVMHTVSNPATATISLHFVVDAPAIGDTFQLDSVCLTRAP